MLDRLLFALRTRGFDIGAWLGSWKLAIVLMILAGLYHGFLAVWAYSSPAHVVANIAALMPFWIVYGLLFLNTAVCFGRRLGTLAGQLSAGPTLTGGTPDWAMETGPEVGLGEARALLGGLGHRSRRIDEGWWGVRQRWGALGSYFFHGALLMLATGFLLTLVARQEASVWVAEGEDFEGLPEQFRARSPPRLLAAGLPSVTFRPERITPEYWRDQLLFTRLRADLVLPGERMASTRINQPLWWDWRSFLRLSGFGYALRFELVDRDGRILQGAFVKLNVFPPGQRDYFQAPGYPHRFHIEVIPDLDWVAGEPITRSLNLANPGIAVHVVRGRVDLGRSVLTADESFEFEGLRIRFPEIRYWGEFAIVSDPGAPLLFAGYLAGLGGLLLKLRGDRSELTWHPSAGGRGVLRGWGVRRPAETET